ncbi:MAG: zinc-dependent metalloprotease family protein [Gammaproteobacteria bacterium]
MQRPLKFLATAVLVLGCCSVHAHGGDGDPGDRAERANGPSFRGPGSHVDNVLTGPCLRARIASKGRASCAAKLFPRIVASVPRTRRLSLALSPEISVTAERTALQRNPAGFSWFGILQGQSGEMVVTADGGVVFATVHTDGEVHRLRQIGPGQVVIEALPPPGFSPEDPPHALPPDGNITLGTKPPPATWDPRGFDELVTGQAASVYEDGRIPEWKAQVYVPPPPHEEGFDLLLDDGSVIDVLPVVTQTAVEWIVAQTSSGTYSPHPESAARAYVQHAIDQLNVALNESGVHTWFNMLQPRIIAYQGVNDPTAELKRLKSKTDGALDELHDWRNQAVADLVVLIGGPDDYAGVFGGADTKLFEVNDPGVFLAIFNVDFNPKVFAHEVGHLLALGHDWFVQDGPEGVGFNPTDHAPDGHGHNAPVVIVNGQYRQYRTLMAYAAQCEAIFENSSVDHACVQLNRFSNPNLHFVLPAQNVAFPLGIPQPLDLAADSVRAANSQIRDVANYRLSACRNFPAFPFCPN